MSKITPETIKKVAKLAKIRLRDDETEVYAKQIESILEYFETINEVDVEGIKYKSHVDLKNVTREDETEESLNREELLSQTQNKNGYVTLPAVIDSE